MRTFLLSALIAATAGTPSSAATSFQAEVAGDDIWLHYKDGSTHLFDYRLGAGGAVSQLISASEGKRSLLAPSFGAEITDRVIQLAMWDTGNQAPPGSADYNDYWNVDQAGTEDNLVQATVSVKVSNTKHRIDVYSVSDSQWKANLRRSVGYAFNGRVSMLTRYDLSDDGVLRVRRIVHLGRISRRNGAGQQFVPLAWQQPYHQNWIPLRAGATNGNFDALALGLDARGTPNWWYRWNDNIPTAGWRAENTNGYVVAYNSARPASTTFQGVIFGTKRISSPYPGSKWDILLTGYSFPTYGVLVPSPEMHLTNTPDGVLIDSTIALYPGTALNKRASEKMKSLVSTIPQPSVYAPNHSFSGEMAKLVSTIREDEKMTLTNAMRVDHLGSRVTP